MSVDSKSLMDHLDAQDPRDLHQTVLHIACGLGYTDMSLHLMRAGSNIEVRDELGLTPIETAAMNDRKSLVSTLLTTPDFDENFSQLQMSNGSTVLHLACAQEMLDVVDYICSKEDTRYKSLRTMKNFAGDTIVNIAAELRDDKCLLHLLTKYPDLMEQYMPKDTNAGLQGSFGFMQPLGEVERMQQNRNKQTIQGLLCSLLDSQKRSTVSKILDLFPSIYEYAIKEMSESSNGDVLFEYACFMSFREIVDKFISMGVAPYLKAITYACLGSDTSIALEMLNRYEYTPPECQNIKCMDFGALTEPTFNPALAALQGGHYDLSRRILTKYPAMVNIDPSSTTVFNISSLKLIYEHRKEDDLPFLPQGSLIGYACYHGDEEMYDYFVGLGADVTENFEMLIKITVHGENLSILEKLIEYWPEIYNTSFVYREILVARNIDACKLLISAGRLPVLNDVSLAFSTEKFDERLIAIIDMMLDQFTDDEIRKNCEEGQQKGSNQNFGFFGSSFYPDLMNGACKLSTSRYLRRFLGLGVKPTKKNLFTVVNELFMENLLLILEKGVESAWIGNALTRACYFAKRPNGLEVFRTLLNYGAKPSDSAVLSSVLVNDIECLQELIARGYDLASYSTPRGTDGTIDTGLRQNSSIHFNVDLTDPLYAISFKKGDTEMLEFLLSNGATMEENKVLELMRISRSDISSTDEEKFECLSHTLIKECVNRGIPIDSSVSNKQNFLDVAFVSHNMTHVLTLLSFGAKLRPFHPQEQIEAVCDNTPIFSFARPIIHGSYTFNRVGTLLAVGNVSTIVQVLKAFPNFSDLLDPLGVGHYILAEACKIAIAETPGTAAGAQDPAPIINLLAEHGLKPSVNHVRIMVNNDETSHVVETRMTDFRLSTLSLLLTLSEMDVNQIYTEYDGHVDSTEGHKRRYFTLLSETKSLKVMEFLVNRGAIIKHSGPYNDQDIELCLTLETMSSTRERICSSLQDISRLKHPIGAVNVEGALNMIAFKFAGSDSRSGFNFAWSGRPSQHSLSILDYIFDKEPSLLLMKNCLDEGENTMLDALLQRGVFDMAHKYLSNEHKLDKASWESFLSISTFGGSMLNLHCPFFQRFLKSGIDFNEPIRDNEHILQFLLSSGNEEKSTLCAFDILIDAGASLPTKDSRNGWLYSHPLEQIVFQALGMEFYDVARRILALSPSLALVRDLDGSSLLAVLCKMVRGTTPQMFGSLYNDSNQRRRFQIKSHSKIMNIISYVLTIVDTSEFIDDILSICQLKDPELLRTFVEAGANINVVNNEGMTPLVQAIQTPDNEIFVQTLIDLGADVNLPVQVLEFGNGKRRPKTPLWIAVNRGNN